jgi:hypothetical protein
MPLPQVAETDRASSPPGAQSGVISGSLPQSGVVSRLEPQSGIISGLAETHQRSYARDGFLSFEGAVNRERLLALRDQLLHTYQVAKTSGQLFAGGGTAHGHLNCFPGAISRFVLDELEANGIIDVARALSSGPIGQPNIGCNLNLPGSHPQNEHIDGYVASRFMIVNVAVVDTDLSNGAMEVIPGTHRREYKYWQLLAERPKRKRMIMKAGDAIVRPSTLWHRGMPNPSRTPRPMLAFTWEDGGSKLSDPYKAQEGRITFLPNRYATDLKGRIIERAYIAAPRVASAVRAVRSIF